MDDVKEVMDFAASKRVKVDSDEVLTFLQAKRILAKKPDNVHAKEVVENFARHLATGKLTPSFAEFMMGEEACA